MHISTMSHDIFALVKLLRPLRKVSDGKFGDSYEECRILVNLSLVNKNNRMKMEKIVI